MRKKILNISALMLIATPIIGVASCFKQVGRFNSPDKGIIEIYAPLEFESAAEKSLSEIIEYYNSEIVGDGYKVRVNTFYETKKSPHENLDNWIDKFNTIVPNIVISNDDAASIVRKYDMLNNLNPNEELGISLENYNEKFLNQNSQLANRDKETFIVPLGQSMQHLVINKPLLVFLINRLIDSDKAILDPNAMYIKSILQVNYDKEINKIGGIWGDNLTVDVPKPDLPSIGSARSTSQYSFTQKFVVTDSILDNFEAMMEFADNARKLFADDRDLYVLAVDSPSSLLYGLQRSTTSSDKEFIYSLDGKSLVKNYFKSSEYDNKTEDIFNMIQSGLDSKTIVFADEERDASYYQKFHKAVFSISSTEQYANKWTESSYLRYLYTNVKNEEIEILTNKKVQYNYKFDKNYKEIELGTVDGIKFYSYDYDGIVPYGGIRLNEFNTDTYLNYLHDSSSDNELIYMSELKDNQKVTNAPANLVRIPLRTNSNGYIYNYIVMGGEEIGLDSTLQENEIELNKSFQSKFTDSSNEASFVSGYNMFAIHRNAREDAETLKFLKWFTEPVKLPPDDSEENDETARSINRDSKYGPIPPATHFATQMGLVIPNINYLANPYVLATPNEAQFQLITTLRNDKWFNSPLHSDLPYIKSKIDSELSKVWEHPSPSVKYDYRAFLNAINKK